MHIRQLSRPSLHQADSDLDRRQEEGLLVGMPPAARNCAVVMTRTLFASKQEEPALKTMCASQAAVPVTHKIAQHETIWSGATTGAVPVIIAGTIIRGTRSSVWPELGFG